MDETLVIGLAQEAILVTLQVIAVPLVIALVIGVAVSLFNVLTSINEQTLTFAPKIVLVMLTVLILLPWMIKAITSFAGRLVDRIVSLH